MHPLALETRFVERTPNPALGPFLRSQIKRNRDFSDAFRDRYGILLCGHAIWKLYITRPVDHLRLKYRGDFFVFEHRNTFVMFATSVDDKFRNKRIIDRVDMEAIYVQTLLKKFDEMRDTSSKLKTHVGKTFKLTTGMKLLQSNEDVVHAMKDGLLGAILAVSQSNLLIICATLNPVHR